MSAVNQYEIDWRTEKLLKSAPAGGPSVFVLGLAKSGFVKPGGSDENWQLFTGDAGASLGMPMPVAARATRIAVSVVSNTLSGSATIRLMKNEADTSAEIVIPAGATGVRTASVNLAYSVGDTIMLHFISGGDPGEDIDIAGVSIAFETT